MSERKVGSENLKQRTEIPLELNSASELSVLKNALGNCLKEAGVYDKSNLYRFIPSENQSKGSLTTEGTDYPEFDSIFAFSHKNIFSKSSYLPKEYLFNYGGKNCSYTCIISVYDGSQFINDGSHHYTFIDPVHKLRTLRARDLCQT